MDPQVLISISQLSHVYAVTRKKTGRRALHEVNLDIHSGETMALLGPNGSGKSTLLRVLTTALVPTSGAVRVGGKLLAQDPAAVRRQLGVVFQNPALDGKMTVGENLRMAGSLYGMSRRAMRQRSQQLLEIVGLWERRNERVEKLSGGMRRRVELAKALLPAPAILVLDEPTTGLDPVARQDFWYQVEELKADEQLTVVVSTHLLDEAERANRVAILHQGELLVCGPPRVLQRQLGREILTLRSDDVTALQVALRCDMGLEGLVVDQDLRVPLNSNISLDEVFQRFGSQIRSLSLAPPSLDDVFVRHTGQHLEEGNAA
ncbi:MAG: ABC transporter ATP-binding protein [Gemmatimonadetes bacterium]|nr:ABC transporter ATP-binding protein [Gemmatimonadota bacterium]